MTEIHRPPSKQALRRWGRRRREKGDKQREEYVEQPGKGKYRGNGSTRRPEERKQE